MKDSKSSHTELDLGKDKEAIFTTPFSEEGETKGYYVSKIAKKMISVHDSTLLTVCKEYLNSYISVYCSHGERILFRNHYFEEFPRFTDEPKEVKGLFQHFPKEVCLEILEKLKTASLGEKLFQSEISVHNRVLYSQVLAINDPVTHQKSVLVFESDISRLKTVSFLMSKFGHEIRTPLNGIIGSLQCLNMKELTDDAKYLSDMTLNYSKTLISLLDNMLDYSKLEAGCFKVDRQDYKLKTVFEVIEDACNNFSLVAFKKNLEILIEYPCEYVDSAQTLKIDVKRLKQILLNLISNSIKYTSQGFVKVKVELKQDKFIFVIQDSGIGISQENMKSLFKPYFQVNNSDSLSGTGLGLHISKDLVELNEGKIDIESLEGQGTTISIEFPFQRIQEEPKKIKSFLKSILVVSDSKIYSEYLKNLIEDSVNIETSVKTYSDIKEVTLGVFNTVIFDQISEEEYKRLQTKQDQFKAIYLIRISDQISYLRDEDMIFKPIYPFKFINMINNQKEKKFEKKDDSETILLVSSKIENNILEIFKAITPKVEHSKEIEFHLQTFTFVFDEYNALLELGKKFKRKNVDGFLIGVVDTEKLDPNLMNDLYQIGFDDVIRKSSISLDLINSMITKWKSVPKDYLENVNILIADDNSLNREILSKMLKRYGNCNIIQAKDGKEGLQKFNTETNISLVFLDINMPELNGYLVSKYIRESNRTVPIILFTGAEVDMDSIKQYKINDFIIKPIYERNLKSIIYKWVKKEETKVIRLPPIQVPEWSLKPSSFENINLEPFNLITQPVYTMEITNDKRKLQFGWANAAALRHWKKNTMEEFKKIDLSDSSEKNLSRLNNFIKIFQSGIRDLELETFLIYPSGVPTVCQVTRAPFYFTESGNWGFLVNVISKGISLSDEDIRILFTSKLVISSIFVMFNETGDTILFRNTRDHPFDKYKTLKEQFSQTFLQELFQKLDKSFSSQKFISTVSTVEENGNTFYYITDFYNMKDPVTGSRSILVHYHNITKLKDMTKFLSSISHAVRTPMNGVMGILQTLKKEEKLAEYQDQLNVALQSASSLMKIMNNIIKITQSEDNHFISKKYVDYDEVTDLIEDIVEMYKQEFSIFVESSPYEKSTIRIDLDVLRQIFGNILSHSSTTLISGSIRITISIDHSSKSLIINFKTNGLKNLIQNVDYFDLSSQREYNHGLELIFVKYLVNQMNGGIKLNEDSQEIIIFIPVDIEKPKFEEKITFKSPVSLQVSDKNFNIWIEEFLKNSKIEIDTKDKSSILITDKDTLGLKKTILLSNNSTRENCVKMNPLKSRDIIKALAKIFIDKVEEPQKSPRVEFEFSSKIQILVVEDNLINQLVLKNFLKKIFKNGSIDYAVDGKQGVDQFKKKKFSIVLMDINMPVMNGIESTKIMREIEKGQEVQTPIMAITANLEIEKLAMDSVKFDEICHKPIIEKELIQKLEKLLKVTNL